MRLNLCASNQDKCIDFQMHLMWMDCLPFPLGRIKLVDLWMNGLVSSKISISRLVKEEAPLSTVDLNSVEHKTSWIPGR